jgi:hypothetical protein
MANITGFRASLPSGGVRPNQFRVDLQFPTFVANGAAASALGQFHCKAASLPASTVAPVPVFYNGRSINVAGEREFQPWQITVYNENFAVRDAFERWSHGINNISDNSGIIQPSQYQVDLFVTHLDRNGAELKKIKIVDAMPIEISPIELDWEQNNVVEVFQVVFAYNYFESSGVNG